MIQVTWGIKWCAHLTENLELSLDVWSAAIADFTEDQITAAIQKCAVTLDYPPSIAKFRKCAIGIIEPEAAYTLRDTDNIAKMAWESIDAWTRRTGNEKDLKREFISIYKNLAEKLLAG